MVIFTRTGSFARSVLAVFSVLVAFQLASVRAQETVAVRQVVIVEPQAQQDLLTTEIVNEIQLLLREVGGVDVRSVKVPADATSLSIETFIENLYRSPQLDMVVVADVGLNRFFINRQEYPVPTILSFVFDAAFNGIPSSNGASGKQNLTYIAPTLDLRTEFEAFRSVASIKSAVLTSNDRVIRRLPDATKSQAIAAAKTNGFDLNILSFDNDVTAFVDSLPAGTDTVFIGVLPDSAAQNVRSLLATLTQKGISTFVIGNESYVPMGALASNSPAADTKRIARRTAIHVAEMLAGAPADRLPVAIDMNNQLTINMATARALKVGPSYDVLSSAKLLNNIEESTGTVYSLTQVAREAVRANLSLMAQRFRAQEANARIQEARSSLLPQLSADVSFLQRRKTQTVRAGLTARQSTDGSLSLTQSIFNEAFWAGYAIEKYNALSERELLREVELDIIRAAVETYLSVLREKTSLEQAVYNLEITRENLRLARNRVDVGTEDASDLFRWQSELATAKQQVLSTKAGYEQLRQQLNQILNKPIKEPFGVTVERLDNPDLLVSDDRVIDLISNAYDFQVLTDYFVEVGLARSPEISQAQVAIDASNRQLLSDKRQFWMPDVSLVGSYNNNFDEDRDLGFGGVPAQDDWSITVQASIPLFEGGARYSRVSQSKLAVRQSEAAARDTRNQIEQNIRNAVEAMNASYNSIPLANEAEAAAMRNYSLVAASYAQGQRDIINVLDAQDALISAREQSLNAVFSFLIDLMNTQRAIGGFDFFLDDSAKLEFSNELIRRVRVRQSDSER